VAWSAGALVLFAFLVWYLTGRSIAAVLAVGPPAVLNAVGWFLLVLAAGYPLWAASTAFRVSRRQVDPFREPNAQEVFVSGYLAHRTFAAALAPLFQLVFIVELVTLAIISASRGGGRSHEIVTQLMQQMRAEWSEALIVVLVFQFAYLVLLASEARFARRVDRCELLVRRAPWESVWPVFLLGVLLASVITTDVLALTLGAKQTAVSTLIWRELLKAPTQPFEIVKTLVFQGTFLLGLAATTMFAAFPLTELLAASRAVFHAADEASVATRAKYFMRSIAALRVARGIWLYGGAMIGTLTAMRILSDEQGHPLLEKLVYIIGPSLIGFVGYRALRARLNGFLEQAPAVKRLVVERTEAAPTSPCSNACRGGCRSAKSQCRSCASPPTCSGPAAACNAPSSTNSSPSRPRTGSSSCPTCCSSPCCSAATTRKSGCCAKPSTATAPSRANRAPTPRAYLVSTTETSQEGQKLRR
jgi:hypothetical protein